jgi:hypothetical protein
MLWIRSKPDEDPFDVRAYWSADGLHCGREEMTDLQINK